MVTIERRSRKGPILTPSSLPCLSGMPTINITEGCAHRCTYCYTQGYSNYPGAERIVLFDNTAELVKAELARKRRRPRRVYFSPSSDAFQPLPEVQEIAHQTMAVLLDAGVEVAFLTKGIISEAFVALFARMPAMVFAQIGITTLEEELWRVFEPGAASPFHRLENIAKLRQIGVAVKARLDPLTPELTDAPEGLSRLLCELAHRGVRDVAASYLFLRSAFARKICEQLKVASGPAGTAVEWAWQPMADGVGGAQMLDAKDRRERFARLVALAGSHGITVHVCTCKNPDLAFRGDCEIAGSAATRLAARGSPLFDQGAESKPCPD